MTTNKTTFDVFISYSHASYETAKEVAEILRSRGITVYYNSKDSPIGSNIEDITWEAMAESHALVVVLPEQVNSPWLTFELGAAKAWNKPIYAVSAFSSHQNLPVLLRNIEILPISRAEEIADSISSTTQPLTQEDIQNLFICYSESGLSVDQLLTQPKQLSRLVNLFNKKCSKHMSGEQVMCHLLRLRKQGSLPSLKKSKRH